MKIIPFLFMFFSCVSRIALAQNVGINTTGATPAASAMLDISSPNSGLLVPRVALTATNAAGPIISPATSLLVYNSATEGAAPNNVVPGYYYWNGSSWIAFTTSSAATTVKYRSGTEAYIILATDYAIIHTGGGTSWTLPPANTCAGRIYRLINQGTAAVALTEPIRTAHGAATTNTLPFGAGGNFEILSDGSEWRKIN